MGASLPGWAATRITSYNVCYTKLLRAAVQDLVDFVVARLLDHLGLPQDLMAPWGQ